MRTRSFKVFLFPILCLVLVLLTYFPQETAGNGWDNFQRQHVLDPSVESGYGRWNRVQWNSWLKTRLGSDYGTKTINSIITASPSYISKAYSRAELRHNSANNLYWSDVTFPVYVEKLVRSTGSYDIYNCGPQYVLAGLVRAVPVHFHRYSKSRPTTGNIQSDVKSCTRVN